MTHQRDYCKCGFHGKNPDYTTCRYCGKDYHLDLLLREATIRSNEQTKTFFGACISKFLKKAQEDNRSLEPWKDHTTAFLFQRLEEEIEELDQCITDNLHDLKTKEDIRDGLIDVSNFCMFLFLALEENKK